MPICKVNIYKKHIYSNIWCHNALYATSLSIVCRINILAYNIYYQISKIYLVELVNCKKLKFVGTSTKWPQSV